jgi:glycerophosphoryl diester phosphodiesterase
MWRLKSERHAFVVGNRYPQPMKYVLFASLVAMSALAGGPISVPVEVHGHRGARGLRPENTLPAFEYAIE